MHRPLRVAVVVPVFNAEAFLPETLASIRAQRRRADEIIVVDDASTDRSPEIARSFGVTVIDRERSAPSGGPSIARNRAIRSTTADVIALCDADDVWLDDHLESLVGLLEQFPAAALAFSRVQLFGAMNHAQESAIPSNVPTEAFWQQYHENIAFPSGTVFRKAAWSEVGGFDDALYGCEDWEFTLRVAAKHPIVCADRITARYRKHPTQMTSTTRPRIRRTEYDVRARMLADARAHESPEFVARMERALLETWLGRLRESWAHRDWTLMRLYLSLHPMIPGSGPAFRKWSVRSALMPVAWMADRFSVRPNAYGSESA